MRIWILALLLGAVLIGKTGLQCVPNSDALLCHDAPQLSAPAPSAAPVDIPAIQPFILSLQAPVSMVLLAPVTLANATSAFSPALRPPPPR